MRAIQHILTAMLLLPSPAFSNDTTARIGVGGLVFTKNNQIAMVSEHLIISTSKIEVEYSFLNTSDSEIETVVAFPTPSYSSCRGGNTYANEAAVQNFKITIDGTPIKPKLIRTAVVGQVDITSKLRAAGLADSEIFAPQKVPFCEELEDAQKPWVIAQRRRLKIYGLLGKTWKTNDTYYWTQVFPAKTVIQVRHEYVPFVGRVFSGGYSTLSDKYSEIKKNFRTSTIDEKIDLACTSEGTKQAIEKHAKAMLKDLSVEAVEVYLHDVEYILGTGRNWKGPIVDFTLDVVKDSSTDTVSLCFPGVPQRINERTLRFKQKNFVPRDRLQVNFYSLNFSQ